MELTGLKSFKNAGGSVYSSIGSSDSSKTIGYKQINNLPKFENGTPGQQQSSTSSGTSNTSLADNYGGWGNQQFNNSVTTPETTSTGSTSMPSVTNISSGPSLTTVPGFVQSSSSPSFNTSLSTIKSSLTSPNGSQLLDQNGFGGSNYKQPTFTPIIDWSSGSQRAAAIGQIGALANSIGSGKPINLNKSNQILQNSIGSTSGGAKRLGSGAAGGKGFNWSGVGSVVTSGVQFAGDAINSFSVNETGEDLQNKYGTSQQNVAGVGYESQNMIDANKELDRVKKENTGNTLKATGSGAALGAAVGSVIPGLGTAAGAVIGGAIGLFTGLFGGASRKRRYREMLAKQNAKINALQDSSRFSAQTKAIQIQNAKEYGDSESQYLYGAKEGKLPRYNNGVDTPFIKLPVYSQTGKPTFSAFGPINIKPNAKVSSGEEIVNVNTGSAYRIPGKKNNKDTEYAYLNPGDMVVTNKDGLSDYYAMTGDYEGTREMLKNRLETAKNGRLPKFDNGWLGNAITSGIGALGGLSQWLEAKNSTPKKTNSYRANPYEQEALTTLASLDINPYPITTQLRNAETRSNKAIDMSGGLSTGQRTLSRLAALHNTQQNIANMLASLQNQRNQYKSAYATAALNAGQADRQARMAAYQWDEDMYAKAHAARQQGMQMGMRNMIDSVGSYWQNAFKQNQFDRMMNLYQQDMDLKKDEIQSMVKTTDTNKTKKKSTASSINPTYSGNYNLKKDWGIKANSRLKNPELFWGNNYSLTAPVFPTSYTAYKYIKPYDNIRIR